MPPPRRVLPQDDSHSRSEEGLAPKQKGASHASGRRKPNGHANTTHSLREIASSNNASAAMAAMNGIGDGRLEGGSLFDWSSASPALLHRYSYHHRLPLPTAFHNPGAPQILSANTGFGRAAGIGKYSPTMARPKAKQRVPKEELTKLVRKHFNSMSVSEGDVVVDLMYRVKFEDKAFSAKVAPSRRNVVDSGGGAAPVVEPLKMNSARAEYAKGQSQR